MIGFVFSAGDNNVILVVANTTKKTKQRKRRPYIKTHYFAFTDTYFNLLERVGGLFYSSLPRHRGWWPEQFSLFLPRGGPSFGFRDFEFGPVKIASFCLRPQDREQADAPRTDQAFAHIGASAVPLEGFQSELLRVFRQ